ncbi:hypothetical protein, partial [Microcoleus sp.]|uniref:hypothetical protein n=1 Tax=Microcoleus sp. TaxID=44472 RepID=UPI00403E5327
GFAAGDVNFYAYTSNNPVNNNDPSGKILPVIAACAANPACAGAVSSVVLGGVIRAATGGKIFDLGAIATDAALGAAGVGLANKFSQIRALGNATTAARGNTRVFRVEGAANQRIGIDAAGNVAAQGDNALFLNFGNASRAQSFRGQRLGQGFDDSVIKAFDVPTSFVDDLGRNAVPESLARQFPTSPFLVDTTKAANQFGLRAPQIQSLNSSIVQGSGTTIGSGFGQLSSGSSALFGGAIGGFANGGFLLYPNKTNTNMQQSVYSK